MTAAPRITRHFASVGGRRVHYHRAGSGPALVMFHASPRSAWEMRDAVAVFAGRFTVLALDTPGFGLSDPLDGDPSIERYADAAAETLSALGVARVAAYGRHTGAAIAVEFAARHPARCVMALCNGFPVYSAAQQQDRLTRYLQPIVPSFEGGHLLWLWFRYREQHVFWPWHEHRAENRARTDVPGPAALHRGVLDFLDAGERYREGYATAFRHRGLAALADLRVPVCFGYRRSDSLYRAMALFPPGAWTQEMPPDLLDAAAAELAVLEQHRTDDPVPPPPPTAPLPGRTTLSYLDGDETQLLLRSAGEAGAAPVLLLHHAPGSSALYDGLVARIGARRPALAIDGPGQGESDFGDVTPEAGAAAAERALDALGHRAAHVYGHGSGAAAAVELALRCPGRVLSLTLDAPLALDRAERDALAPGWLDGVRPVEPCWDGGHWLRAWHMLRDLELWWPWHDRRMDAARDPGPRLDPARLTVRLREAMKHPDSFAPAWEAAMSYPLPERLAHTGMPCLLMAAPTDPFARCLPTAAAARPDAGVITVADTDKARADAVLAALPPDGG